MLTVHRADRADVLAQVLAGILVVPLDDPLTTEIVAASADGVRRWLRQSLAVGIGGHVGSGRSQDGISANIAFPTPDELIADISAQVRGHRLGGDPWSSDRVVWHLMDILEQISDAPGRLGLVRRACDRGDQRFASAARIASLFGGYSVKRPQMITAWATGDDTDGYGEPLPEHRLWQPTLWRMVRDRIGVRSPAEVLPDICEELRANPEAVDMPSRLSFFAISSVNTQMWMILDALRVHRELHIYLHYPGERLWTCLRNAEAALNVTTAGGCVHRRADLAVEPGDLSTATLSGERQEVGLRLGRLLDADLYHGGKLPARALLHHMQRTITDGVPPVRSAGLTADGTFEVHTCHGAARQVEAMRERLVHLFNDDDTLQPRDVVVMCPDIRNFAPYIRAAFDNPDDGDKSGHPGRRLRVRLAERGSPHANVVLESMANLMSLSTSRITVAELISFIESPPVRRRFEFDDDDMATVLGWLEHTYVRWGIDERQRADYGLPGFPHNTAAAGLDRILLGVVADESRHEWLNRVLPLDDIDSTYIDLAGRLAELISRLGAAVSSLRREQSAAQWATAIIDAFDSLAAVPDDESWQYGQAVETVLGACEFASATPLSSGDMRSILEHAMISRRSWSYFCTGDLTVTGMAQLRSVPHRVVILLGMDDHVFPRVAHVDGDDIAASDPLVGESDSRLEDRQLLCDALMSATDAVLIFCTGIDPVSGIRRPLSAPVAEILDIATSLISEGSSDTTTADAQGPVLMRRHPLHPFDVSEFRSPRPVSFDVASLRAACAMRGPRLPHAPLVAAPLTPVTGDVELDDLISFAEHPVRCFIRRRLGVTIPQVDDGLSGEMAAGLTGLDRWQVGDRLLRHMLNGADMPTLRNAEIRRGSLPPFALGEAALNDVVNQVESLIGAARDLVVQQVSFHDIDVDIGDGRRLVGTLGDIRGDVVLRVDYAKLSARQRISTWTKLLVASVARVCPEPSAILVARGGYGGRVRRLRWRPPSDPLGILMTVIRLYDLGMCAPLPVSPASAARYAECRLSGHDHRSAYDEARTAWTRSYEHDDQHLRLAFPGGFDDMAGRMRSNYGWSENNWAFLPPTIDAESLFADISGALWATLIRMESGL